MAYRYRSEPPKSAQPGDILIVIHDFDARSGDELNLRKGDRVELLELDEGFGDGWYLGKSMTSGVTGLFPGVYTTSAPRLRGPSGGTRNTPTEVHQVPLAAGSRISQDSTATTISPDDSRRQPNNHTESATLTSSMPPNIQRSIGETMDSHDGHGQDSPVMNETLSVIDEHITDMNTPRHSFIGTERRGTNDSGSEYSSHIDHRISYITGHETDEEEDTEKLTEQAVLRWSPAQTAQHLRSLGVEAKHCEVFEEQEISGEVLLGMDQASIFMREFDLGVVGRRLRTWHKIKALQDEVKGPRQVGRATPSFSGGDSSAESLEPQGRSTIGNTLLPRIPSLMEGPGTTAPSFRQSRQATYPQPHHFAPDQFQTPPPAPPHSHLPGQSPGKASPKVSPFIPSAQGSPRPSAASVRELGHSRRHSSLEVPSRPGESTAQSSPAKTLFSDHHKQGSFDRNWTMTGPAPPFTGQNQSLSMQVQSLSADRQAFDTNDLPVHQISSMPDELDRGYFSSGEMDSRRTRNVLRKRDSASVSASHSRQSSMTDDHKHKSKRHSRLASADSIRDSVPSVTSPAAKAYYSNSFKGRFRSASARTPDASSPKEIHSPTVTNLEAESKSSSSTTATPPARADVEQKTGSPQISLQIRSSVSKARRGMGLRAISDAVTGNEKTFVSSPSSIPSPVKESSVKESPIQSRSPTMTGSSTPSAASKSLDLETPDSSSKGTNSAPSPAAPPLSSRRSKTKKATSAYIKGLEKKAPKEQIENCDYSGWMKKKSSNLMTTWKPRLFILRGRRLSYYYSEDDQEEKGLIDISSHRVLPADEDIVTSLHATLTGVVASSISPENAKISTTAAVDTGKAAKAKSGAEGMFIFKLVPPRSGISRAVNFTKPTVHYFAVENVKQGRLWMAALMKATIDRDPNQPVETTNKQKTISLKQAKAMNQRPPALMNLDDKTETVADGPKSDQTGLNIRGLSLDDKTGKSMNGGSHKLSSSLDGGASSTFPSPPKTANAEKSEINDDSTSGNLKQTISHASSHQPETIAARFA